VLGGLGPNMAQIWPKCGPIWGVPGTLRVPYLSSGYNSPPAGGGGSGGQSPPRRGPRAQMPGPRPKTRRFGPQKTPPPALSSPCRLGPEMGPPGPAPFGARRAGLLGPKRAQIRPFWGPKRPARPLLRFGPFGPKTAGNGAPKPAKTPGFRAEIGPKTRGPKAQTRPKAA